MNDLENKDHGKAPGKDIDDLARRISVLRAQNDKQERKNHGPSDGAENQGIGQAFRVGTELLSGLIVGVGIGWALDQWLGTKPWLMLVFFFLGAGAGILNVYRSTGLIGGQNEDGARENQKILDNPTDSNDLYK